MAEEDDQPESCSGEPAPEQKKKLELTRETADGIVIPSDFQLRTAWKAVEQVDKMVEARGGKPIRPADEKG